MKLNTNRLAAQVRLALAMGAGAAVAAGSAHAQNADAGSTKNQNLETIVVTGSNIRRVDMETSNPVVTIDRAAIEKSGKVTLGDLIQNLPAIAGNANNPRVNNGGGTGGSFISLRGLGTTRSLVLIDGHRAVSNDVNMIPANMVERIETLLDGAGAIYGSDAIGGVVNVILRSNYQGAEASAQYGISDHDDGARHQVSVTFGHSTDKGSILAGLEYNKNDQILAGNRDYSKHAFRRNANTGLVTFTGAPGTPTGFITAPQFANCPFVVEAGGSGGTLDPSAPGGNGIPKGFRCFNPSTATSLGDLYEFAPVNLISTNGERTNGFIKANYKLTDSVEAYMTVLHNKTGSNNQGAPATGALSTAGLTITAKNPYNPFGVDLGAASADGNDDSLRYTAIGPRIQKFAQVNDQVLLGLKGGIGETSWQWDANVNYGHLSNNNVRNGLFNSAAIASSGALGDNCVMPVAGQPLTTKTCLNIMNQNDPNTIAIMQQFYKSAFYYHILQTDRQANASANGNLFELPAGTVSAAAGLAYRKAYYESDSDTVTHRPPGSRSCGAPNSACSNPYAGQYDVKEAYAEVLVPLLKDMPFIHSLNLTLGDRYSKYSTVGSTNNWKAALEYRPLEDLLLRGTVSKVFRAPNVTESFLPLTTSYDPYTAPAPTADGRTFGSKNGNQIIINYQGASAAGAPISPESGSSFDFGFVYDPQWLPGLSVSADIYRIYLGNLITRPQGQTVVNFCAASASSPYCKYLTYTAGKITSIDGVGYINLGRLDTKGADLAVTYRLPETAFGNFNVGLNATYIAQYDNSVPGLATAHVAGTYNAQYGNFARWRAVGNVGWSFGNFSAQWTTYYFNGTKVPALGTYRVGAWAQNNVSAGYNIEPINTRIDVGIDNLGNRQPPLFYYGIAPNANTDVNTYDTIGRYFWGRVTVKF